MEINTNSLDGKLVKHFNVQEICGSIFVSLGPNTEHGNSLAFHDHEDYEANFQNLLQGNPTVFRNSYGQIDCDKEGIVMSRDNGFSQIFPESSYVQDFIRANKEFYSNRNVA
jgi:hypothetical protein